WRELDECMSAWIACIAGPRSSRGIDARVRRSAHLLRQEEADVRLSERRLAESVALSGSRLRHLFKRETGVPLCRYRVWGRLRRAIQRLGAGATPTDAALHAGFTDVAHFNHAFKANFGVTPMALFGRGRPQPRVVVAPDFVASEPLSPVAARAQPLYAMK
ncbi:MAG TPA: AraC family transcriptional regulator, partial [Dokdonella sp.]